MGNYPAEGAPDWWRIRWVRILGYLLLGLPMIWFGIYEGLILLCLIGVVVEFACFPSSR